MANKPTKALLEALSGIGDRFTESVILRRCPEFGGTTLSEKELGSRWGVAVSEVKKAERLGRKLLAEAGFELSS